MKIKFLYILNITTIILLLLPIYAFSASDFDISVEDLKKIKKNSSSKEQSSKLSKKRKSAKKKESGKEKTKTAREKEQLKKIAETEKEIAAEINSKESTLSTVSNKEPVAQNRTEESSAVKNIATNHKNEVQAGAVTLLHTPYSYILPNRRTVIKAVISSVLPLEKVKCIFYADDNSNQKASVEMLRDKGTKFTYSAKLPALDSEAKRLSYKIYVAIKDGDPFESELYRMPVTPESVMPGWQTESLEDDIEIDESAFEEVMKGFADPSIAVESIEE